MDSIKQCVPLDSVDANILRKWGSAWLDLTHTDMVLLARRNTPATRPNLFVRRALWESAVVSYGRVGQGNQRRKIDLAALFVASGDSGASDFHDSIMRWRHGHVAHRADAVFESVDALLSVDAALIPNALQLVIQPEVGPQDDEELAERFRAHVYLMRNTIWESFMDPLATKLAERARSRPADLEKMIPYPSASPEGFIATLTLWANPQLGETTSPPITQPAATTS
ncbi:hypothetical protein ACFVVM_27280 [Nocardia sp. NPDC058176]|uniref:hypothetical protein n=1 Tax=Nocardia sp. NPDC058176 TaxID=3346368 RepID=UPI0036D7CB9C